MERLGMALLGFRTKPYQFMSNREAKLITF